MFSSTVYARLQRLRKNDVERREIMKNIDVILPTFSSDIALCRATTSRQFQINAKLGRREPTVPVISAYTRFCLLYTERCIKLWPPRRETRIKYYQWILWASEEYDIWNWWLYCTFMRALQSIQHLFFRIMHCVTLKNPSCAPRKTSNLWLSCWTASRHHTTEKSKQDAITKHKCEVMGLQNIHL